MPPVTTSSRDDSSDSDNEASNYEHICRLAVLEKCESETLQMLLQVRERFRRHQQLIEDMRQHLLDQEAGKQRKLRRKLKKLRLLTHDRDPSAAAADVTRANSVTSQSSQSAAKHAHQPTMIQPNRAPVPVEVSTDIAMAEAAPPPTAAPDEPPLLRPADEPRPALSPPPPARSAAAHREALVAPFAVAARGDSVSSSGMKPQKAKCSVKRASKAKVGGNKASSRTPAAAAPAPENDPARPVRTGTGIGLAKRSKLTRVVRSTRGAARIEQEGAGPAAVDHPSSRTFVFSSASPFPGPERPQLGTKERAGPPKDPVLFNIQAIERMFGGGPLQGPVWLLPDPVPPNRKVAAAFKYLIVCADTNVEQLPRPMQATALLDLLEWEHMGELFCDNEIPFPLFARTGADQFLFCGVYRCALWEPFPLERWAKLSDETKRYWARRVLSSLPGASMLLEQGLIQTRTASKKFKEADILALFEREPAGPDDTRILRLSRTVFQPVEYDMAVYDELCRALAVQTVKRSSRANGVASPASRSPWSSAAVTTATAATTTTTAVAVATPATAKRNAAPGSREPRSKRLRVDEQPADAGAAQVPRPPNSARPRRHTGANVNYDLVAMSRKDLAESSSNSDGEDYDRAQRSAKTTKRGGLGGSERSPGLPRKQALVVG